jgi:hypothetical protein
MLYESNGVQIRRFRACFLIDVPGSHAVKQTSTLSSASALLHEHSRHAATTSLFTNMLLATGDLLLSPIIVPHRQFVNTIFKKKKKDL